MPSVKSRKYRILKFFELVQAGDKSATDVVCLCIFRDIVWFYLSSYIQKILKSS